MTTAIHTWVKTLGDFPLDPQAGMAWLWAAGGENILWISPAAAVRFGSGIDDGPPALDHRGTLRSLMVDLSQDTPDLQPVRVQQVELMNNQHRDVFTCLARAVPLQAGGYGMLVVAVGAPARSLEEIRAASTSEPVNKPVTAEPAVKSVAPVAPEPELPLVATVPAAAAPAPQIQPVSAPAPRWVEEDITARRPLRFVWQTDDKGRFVHISREMAEAVGPSMAMLLNQTWQESVANYGILESEDIQRGFTSRDTWTAKPALWPVAGSNLGVPVEMAGMLMREDNKFAGFRGYGIARIERAIVRPGTAEEALIADETPQTESNEDRFGPAVQRALSNNAQSAMPLEIAARQDKPVSNPLTAPSVLQATSVSAPVNLRRPLPLTRETESEAGSPVLPTPVDQEAPQRDTTPKPASLHTPEPKASVRDLQRFIDNAHKPAEPVTGDMRSDDIGKNLTEQERSAFREIARALGKTRDEALPPRMARKPLEPQETPQRKKDRDNTAADDSSIVGNPDVKPVISFETAQSLRQQRNQPLVAQNALASVLERLPVGILVMQNGESVFANRMLMDMLGYADFETFLAAGGAEKLFHTQATVPESDTRTYAILDSKGEALQVRATIQATSWHTQPATLTSFVLIPKVRPALSNEVTELEMMATKAELRELQFVLDTATDGIISLDSNGRILGLNRSAEALFGFDQNEVAGESITTLLAPESHVAALDYLEGLKTNGVASIMNDGRDIIGRERHGGSIPLFMTLGRLGDNAKAQRFCAVLRDITAWKKAEADLKEARRIAEDSSANKTDFLARISHEVRTPLNAIIGFSQVMMTESFGPVGNSKYAQYAKDIHASGQHVLSLVNDLLDLSKVSSGKLELAFASVDIQAVVAECVAMIQPQANTGKIIVRSQLSNRLPPVVADERSLRQIVLNLLSNAVKFTDPGGQVIVSATFNDRGEVAIRVRDTGIGMTDEEIKQAMEPFRQIAGPRSAGGTGLGLPLTKALVEANRASFSLASEAGKGTLAEVVFPSTRVLAE
ncbi:MAG: ATP-binding protein [Beijerinckiaceae bacterium]